LSSPLWEGVVFPGLERHDPRALVYDTPVAPELAPYMHAIWFMTWDIPEGTELPGIGVPIPCIKFMANNFSGFQQPLCHFLGTKTKGVMLNFKGQGQAIGIDFKPGGLYPFIGKPLDDWNGQYLNAFDFMPDLPILPKGPWDLAYAEQWAQSIHKYFISKLSNLVPHHLDVITSVVDLLWADREINQVEDLLPKLGVSKRSLQRIFQTEVGLSTKELIRIVRFNRTIKEMNGSSIENFAQFALESGYFDQPHMANDFKKLVAESPQIFRKFW
jgi:AraC-like DNA-binding protein